MKECRLCLKLSQIFKNTLMRMVTLEQEYMAAFQ